MSRLEYLYLETYVQSPFYLCCGDPRRNLYFDRKVKGPLFRTHSKYGPKQDLTLATDYLWVLRGLDSLGVSPSYLKKWGSCIGRLRDESSQYTSGSRHNLVWHQGIFFSYPQKHGNPHNMCPIRLMISYHFWCQGIAHRVSVKIRIVLIY